MKPHVVVCRTCSVQRTVIAASVHKAWTALRREGWIAYWHAPTSAPAHVTCAACDHHATASVTS